ncbi:hypothetical protein Tco_0282014 [Tanacetum coccineum]
MIDELSIVETDKVIHTVETDLVKLVVEIKCFGKSFNEFDKETGSSNGLQPKKADLSCVHALNEPHLHEIHVVPSKHEADQCELKTSPRVLTHFNTWNTTLLQTLDLTVHDLDRFFNEVELVVDLDFI